MPIAHVSVGVRDVKKAQVFYDAVLGALGYEPIMPFSAEGTLVAVGNNNQSLLIDGFTSVTDQATGTSVTGQQGLFAQPSNIGVYTRNTLSVIPELALKLHVDVTDTIKVTLGYGFLAMTQVARPADQLDRNITIQPLGAPLQIGPAFPLRPTSINETTFWSHSLSIGVELVF